MSNVDFYTSVIWLDSTQHVPPLIEESDDIAYQCYPLFHQDQFPPIKQSWMWATQYGDRVFNTPLIVT